jgi:hypothetical protein
MQKITLINLLLLTAFISTSVLVPQVTFAQEGIYKVIIEKEKKKELRRWTLAEWLATKDRNSRMDMWLALNSSDTDYEFYLNLDYATQKTVESSDALGITDQKIPIYRLGFAAYATIVGLEYKHQFMDSYSGSKAYFKLRVFGTGEQNTNLNLFYGVRNYKETILGSMGEESFQNEFFGFSITLYVFKKFGFQTHFENYVATRSDKNFSFDGAFLETSIFVDYSFLRIYGALVKEPIEYTETSSSNSVKWTREGFFGGVKFFF